MSSDIFKVNKDLIEKADNLYYYGYDQIKYSSPYSYLITSRRFRIPKVIFGELCGSELGHYDSSQHLIALDLSLTPENREDDMQNVFLHELAHAIDTALHGASNHDSTFHEICKNLGVNEKFSYAKVSISTQNKMKSKIDKLLALSSSNYENEASAALNKAKELMLTSGLSYLYSDDEDQLYGCVLENSGRLEGYKKTLISFISRITGAFHFLESYNGNKTIKIFGSIDQVETTMYVYNDLIYKIDNECKKLRKYWKENCDDMRFSSSQTKDGIVKGIISQNSDLEKSVKGTAIELSSIKSKEIYCKLYNARFHNVYQRSTVSSQTFIGMNSGKNINVSIGKGSVVKRIGYAG